MASTESWRRFAPVRTRFGSCRYVMRSLQPSWPALMRSSSPNPWSRRAQLQQDRADRTVGQSDGNGLGRHSSRPDQRSGRQIWSKLMMRSRKSVAAVAPTGARAPTTTLTELRTAARECKACDLWKTATQTVFGAGPTKATIMFVGEQPGDPEDRAGLPFVGPAGKLLRDALNEAGIDSSKAYFTNVVKHFKWTAGVFFFNDTATTEIYTLSLHDALPTWDTGRTAARFSGSRPASLRPST